MQLEIEISFNITFSLIKVKITYKSITSSQIDYIRFRITLSNIISIKGIMTKQSKCNRRTITPDTLVTFYTSIKHRVDKRPNLVILFLIAKRKCEPV